MTMIPTPTLSLHGLIRPSYAMRELRRACNCINSCSQGGANHQIFVHIFRSDHSGQLPVPSYRQCRSKDTLESLMSRLERVGNVGALECPHHYLAHRLFLAVLRQRQDQFGARQDADDSLTLHHWKILLRSGQNQLDGSGKRISR